MVPPLNSFRHEIEDLWRDRVKMARCKYEDSVVEFTKILAEQKHWPLPAPDGSTAVRNARIQESAALNDYMRTLKIYTDLVVSGKIPEEH
jgi:hypothetical protein